MASKMTVQQKTLLLEWLEKPENRWVMWTSSREYSTAKVYNKWEEITKILNRCRFGTKKYPEKWRKTFVELRSHIRKKYRTQVAEQQAGKKRSYTLTETERRFANIFRLGNVSEEEALPHAPCDSPVGAEENAQDDFVIEALEDDTFSDESSSLYHKRTERRKKDNEDEEIPISTTAPQPGQCNHPQREAELVTKSWAIKLNRMNPGQRLLAEKFINDIIFEGEMGNLNRNMIRNALIDKIPKDRLGIP